MTPLSRALGSWPRWVLFAAAAMVVFLVAEFLPPLAPGGYSARARNAGFAIFLGFDALLFYLASRRGDLSRRYRRAVALVSLGFGVGALTYLLAALQLLSPGQELALSLFSFFPALGGVLALPKHPVSGVDRRLILADSVLTLVGTCVVGSVLLEVGTSQASDPVGFITDAAALVTTLAVLLLVVANLGVRGVPLPSTRALRYALFGLGTLYLNQVLAGLGMAGVQMDARLTDVTYMATLILLLFSGASYLGDESPGPAEEAGTRYVVRLSPLPIITFASIGFLLLWSLEAGATGAALLSAIGLVLMVLPLLYRIRVMHGEAIRLLQLDAERERRENQGRLDAVGRLSGGLAHELNGLLTVVLGHAELARQSVTAGPLREDLEQIEVAGARAATLTRQLLLFSGGQFTARTPVRFASMVEDLAEALGRQLGAAWPIVLRVEAHEATAPVDQAQLGELLRQLVENAREAMPGGGAITLTVASATLATRLETRFLAVPPGHYATLAVSDRGAGIPPDVLPKIFDPFFTTQPRHAAPGLGLAVVHGVVAAHRGGIEVLTAPGAGTTVRIYLPTTDEVAPPAPSTPPGR